MMQLTRVFCVLALMSVAATAQNRVSYHGDMAVRVYVRNNAERRFVERITKVPDRNINAFYVKFLQAVEVFLKTSDLDYLERGLKRAKLRYSILIRDQQALIDQVDEEIQQRRLIRTEGFDPGNYHTFEEIQSYLQNLSRTTPLAETHNLGMTLEGRGIQLAVVSTDFEQNTKPVIYADCTMHAKEWISTTVCLWILDQLTTKYGKDRDITILLDSYDWHINPVSNPDGYSYTWNTDRLWRKNRAPTEDPSCVGVDLNRNFQVPLVNPSDPCSSSYGGPYAFSEPETGAVRNALNRARGRVKMALFLHSYSQLWLSPYAYNKTRTPHYKEMVRVMKKATDAIKAATGTTYLYGSFASLLYEGIGTAADYAYSEHNVTYSYTVELPDQGSYGFVMPVSKIEPVAMETWEGIKAAAFAVLEKL